MKNSRLVPNLAFPHDESSPAILLELPTHPPVAVAIVCDLGRPVGYVCLGHARPALASVSMPKAAVHENRQPSAEINDVGFAWNVRAMQSVAGCKGSDETTNGYFGSGVAALDGPHDGGAPFRIFSHGSNSILRLGSRSHFATMLL